MNTMESNIETGESGTPRAVEVEAAAEGLRLDQFLAGTIEDASRSLIKKVIKDGGVQVNGKGCTRPSQTMHEGYTITVMLPPAPSTDLIGEDIPLDILYEDAELVIVNKPSGLVVHPAPGHATGTLVHAVLFHCPDFKRPMPDGVAVTIRPGIVHRLDRFTSGVMVVAKSQRAFDHLSRQAREHTFDRRYLALVRGEFKENSGRITATIGRSLSDRSRMSVTSVRAREAVTRFEVLERFGDASLVALQLETGRTHQIRVHLRFAGRPVLGDPVYGITDFARWDLGASLRTALLALNGQALHAEWLGLEHPVTGKRMQFTSAPPEDFETVLALFRERVSHWTG